MNALEAKSETAAGDSKSVTNSKLAYSVPEAAAMLSCGHGSIRKFLRQGRLEKLPGFRKIIIPRTSLERLVNGNSQRAQAA
jgi:hypothetical protein